MKALRSHLKFANVISVVALCIALGGTSYAALTLPRNSVGSKQIKSGAVKSSDVKNSSLRLRDFKRGEVPAGATGPAGALGPKGDAGPQGARGADGADGAEGAPGTVGAASTAFFRATSDLADGNSSSYSVFCPAGKQAIGGGGRGDATSSEQTILTNTRPALSSTNTEPPLIGQGFTGWRITVVNPTGGATTGIRPEVWAVCVDEPTP